jgi:hypothetical protein
LAVGRIQPLDRNLAKTKHFASHTTGTQPGHSIVSSFQQPPSMTGDHQLFVRRYPIDSDTAGGGAEALPSRRVGRLIDFNPKPSGIATDPAANFMSVFSDAGRKHDRVDSAKGCRQRS